MAWKPKIERFRSLVTKNGGGLNPDLVLSLIWQESRGQIGEVAEMSCRPWEIPTSGGGTMIFKYAMGLMQVVPRTLYWYNTKNQQRVTFEDMTGKTMAHAAIQIRVGCWVLLSEIRGLHLFDSAQFAGTTPADIDLNHLRMAMLAYRMGAGALQFKMEKLQERGLALTYENMQNQFPFWGRYWDEETQEYVWKNRPFHYIEKIWQNALNHGMAPGAPSIDEQPPSVQPPSGGGTASNPGALGVIASLWIVAAILGSRK